MAGTPKSRASDMTGRQIAAANKKRDAEQAKRKEELSMASAAAKEEEVNGVVDLSDPQNPEVIEEEPKDAKVEEKTATKRSAKKDDDVEVEEVEVNEKFVTVRVNENVDMSFAGVQYKMDVGPKYKIPAHIADWLEEKGIIWH